MRNRVLVAEQGLVGVPRTSPREEEARTLARARIRDIEFTWATFLVRGMEQGILPEADPRLLTRALLGLYNSIWHWYRPRGAISLEEVTEFFIRRQLALLGLPPELADGDRTLRAAVAGNAGSAFRAGRGDRRPRAAHAPAVGRLALGVPPLPHRRLRPATGCAPARALPAPRAGDPGGRPGGSATRRRSPPRRRWR